MADRIQEGELLPRVQASTSVPDPSIHLDVQPGAFGGYQARGLQEFGGEALTAAQHWGQITADDAANKYTEEAEKILHGDPNKPNPDGTPDLGFMGLKGEAALRARPEYAKRLKDVYDKLAGGMLMADQRRAFDNVTRRQRAVSTGQMGTHADTQANAYAYDTNMATVKQKAEAIAGLPADDDAGFMHNTADIVDAATKAAQVRYGVTSGPLIDVARFNAKAAALETRILTIGAGDPGRAMEMLKQPGAQATLGEHYHTVYNHLDQKLNAEGGATLFQQSQNLPAPGAGSPALPTPGAPVPGHLNTETQGTLDKIRDGLKKQGLDVAPSSTYRPIGPGGQGRQSLHPQGQAFDLPTAGKSQADLEKMFDVIAATPGVNQIGFEGDHFHVGVGNIGNRARTFGPNKKDLSDAPAWFVAKANGWKGTAAPAAAASGTKLEPAEDAKFQDWAKTESARRGFNVDTADYDMRGWWKEHGNEPPQGAEAHWPDTYKLPTHPTFSNESKYSTPENEGGTWAKAGDKDVFIAGPANVRNGIEKTREYLAQNDPNVQLVVPQSAIDVGGTPVSTGGAPAEPTADQRVAQRLLTVQQDAERQSNFIQNSPAKEQQKQHAMALLRESVEFKRNTILAEERVRKEGVIVGYNDYINESMGSGVVTPQQIAKLKADARFTAKEKLDVMKGMEEAANPKEFGNGNAYLETRSRLGLPWGNKDKITDPSEIAQLQVQGKLTPKGAAELQKVFAELNLTNNHAAAQAQTRMLRYAFQKLTFHGNDEMMEGYMGPKDQKAAEIFNGMFTDKVEQAYKAWTKDGKKSPLEFWTTNQMDELLKGVRTEQDKNVARIRAQSAFTGQGWTKDMYAKEKMPPEPKGFHPEEWKAAMMLPPPMANGQSMTRRAWSQAVTDVLTHPEWREAFDRRMREQYDESGQPVSDSLPYWTADELVKRVRPYTNEDRKRDEMELEMNMNRARNPM